MPSPTRGLYEVGDDIKCTRRMVKKAVQHGHSERRGESYPELYGERLSDARTKLADFFNILLDTVSAPHDVDAYLELLKTDGTMILVGVPEKPASLGAFPLISKRRRLVGSMIGGIKETQETLDFCGKRKLGADIEVNPIQQVNEAYGRVVRSDVRYRFVIDMQSLK